MPAWFGADGVVNAHQHRDQDAYRGPRRRLQLTLDLLGKLAWAARTLLAVRARRSRARTGGSTYCAGRRARAASTSRRTAGVWAYRSPAVAFVAAVRRCDPEPLPPRARTRRGGSRSRSTATCRAGPRSWSPGYANHTAGGLADRGDARTGSGDGAVGRLRADRRDVARRVRRSRRGRRSWRATRGDVAGRGPWHPDRRRAVVRDSAAGDRRTRSPRSRRGR